MSYSAIRRTASPTLQQYTGNSVEIANCAVNSKIDTLEYQLVHSKVDWISGQGLKVTVYDRHFKRDSPGVPPSGAAHEAMRVTEPKRGRRER